MKSIPIDVHAFLQKCVSPPDTPVAWDILLVEVGGGKLTSPENVTKAMAFYASIGKKSIRIHKEVKSHIANRLQVALWQEAFSLVERGVASVEDIDTAISYGPGLRWALLGPFLNLHASGGLGGITHTLQHLGPAQREWRPGHLSGNGLHRTDC